MRLDQIIFDKSNKRRGAHHHHQWDKQTDKKRRKVGVWSGGYHEGEVWGEKKNRTDISKISSMVQFPRVKKRKQSKIKTLTEAELASLEIVRDSINEVVDEVEIKEKEKKEKDKEENSILNKAWENVCAEENRTFKDVLTTMIQKDKKCKTITRMKRKAGKLWELEKKQMNSQKE